MTDPAPALDERALEAAFRFAETTDADWISLRPNMVEGTIRAYIAALPAVGEPVAWLHPTAGWAHRNKEEISPHCLADGPGPQPLYPASSLAALQSRVTELEEELAALKAALKPLSERAAKWKHNTDSARISVPLREIRAALASHDHPEMRHNAPCVQQEGGKAVSKLTERQRLLKWIAQKPRYHHEATRRWGGFYEDAIYDDLVECGNSEEFLNGDHRDIRRPVFLTDAGRAAMEADHDERA